MLSIIGVADHSGKIPRYHGVEGAGPASWHEDGNATALADQRTNNTLVEKIMAI